jgi:poly(glycerol-phosphate) alpha-glucosyltransferase
MPNLTAICDAGESQRAEGIPESVRPIQTSGLRPLADTRLQQALRPAIRDCDICHVHGMWQPHTLASRKVAREFNKPIISSVHGMLERWELANKGLKKRIYSSLFERSSLAESACLRALSSREAEDYRRYGLSNPIAVIPNGIRIINRIDPELLFARHPELRQKSIVLFLSRVHHKKGVLELIAAWRRIATHHPDAHLLVAGPNYEGTLEKAQALVERDGMEAAITFCGTLSGEMKQAALSAAKYFCLPSYSEGLSVAVLEALSIGLPVIVTPACNMDEVAAAGAGKITSNQPAELSEALSQALSLGLDDWRRMSSQAVRLARDHYDWGSVAQKMNLVCGWVLGGPKPACVMN